MMIFLSKIKRLFAKKEGAVEPPSFKMVVVNETLDGYELYDTATLQWLGTFPYRHTVEKFAEENGYIL